MLPKLPRVLQATRIQTTASLLPAWAQSAPVRGNSPSNKAPLVLQGLRIQSSIWGGTNSQNLAPVLLILTHFALEAHWQTTYNFKPHGNVYSFLKVYLLCWRIVKLCLLLLSCQAYQPRENKGHLFWSHPCSHQHRVDCKPSAPQQGKTAVVVLCGCRGKPAQCSLLLADQELDSGFVLMDAHILRVSLGKTLVWMSGMDWVDFYLSLLLIIIADFIIICSFSNYSEFSIESNLSLCLKMHHFEIQQLDISPHVFVLLNLNTVNPLFSRSDSWTLDLRSGLWLTWCYVMRQEESNQFSIILLSSGAKLATVLVRMVWPRAELYHERGWSWNTEHSHFWKHPANIPISSRGAVGHIDVPTSIRYSLMLHSKSKQHLEWYLLQDPYGALTSITPKVKFKSRASVAAALLQLTWSNPPLPPESDLIKQQSSVCVEVYVCVCVCGCFRMFVTTHPTAWRAPVHPCVCILVPVFACSYFFFRSLRANCSQLLCGDSRSHAVFEVTIVATSCHKMKKTARKREGRWRRVKEVAMDLSLHFTWRSHRIVEFFFCFFLVIAQVERTWEWEGWEFGGWQEMMRRRRQRWTGGRRMSPTATSGGEV